MMFNVMLSLSVEMDRLVIVSVRSLVEFGGGCVTFGGSIGFSWARTSFSLRMVAVFYAMIGLSGTICFRGGFCCTGFQCWFTIRFILCMSSQNCVLNISFLVVTLLFFCRVCGHSVNLMSFIWLSISFGLYPLCLSLWTRCTFIWLKLCLFEFVLRYLFVSPFIIAFLVAVGWYDSACHIVVCLLVCYVF